ncbi:MAG: hypothetical protein QOJ32_260 [Frankiaceae bacterium]|nr:hypothetical protein [Frankiaceae bacterium]
MRKLGVELVRLCKPGVGTLRMESNRHYREQPEHGSTE